MTIRNPGAIVVTRKKAILLLVATAVLWSLGGLLVKMIDWHPMAIAGMRGAVAALTILLLTGHRPRFNWTAVQLGGALAYCGTITFYVLSTKLTTAANAVLLQYTAPAYVALLGYWILKERTGRFDWTILIATFGGMFLFFLDKLEPGTLPGNILGILSGVSFGLFILCMRKQKEGSPLDTVLLGNLVTAAICIPFMFNSPPDAKGWTALLVLGVIQLGIPYILYSIAVKTVTALEAALVPVLEPLLNPVWVFLFIGERPGPWALLGGAIVLAAVSTHSAVKTAAPWKSRKQVGSSK